MKSTELIKQFWKANEQEKLSISIVSVYFFLLEMWDRNNNSSEVAVSDKTIIKKFKISRSTLKKSKEKLCDLKLVKYSREIGYSCTYEILFDNSENLNTSQNEDFIKEIPKVAEKKGQPKRTSQKIITPIPTEKEFLAFAKSLEIYDPNSPNIDFKIRAKYETWVNNGWKNGHNRPIKMWKTSLKSSLPYLLTNNSFTTKVPVIKRPKQTYNE